MGKVHILGTALALSASMLAVEAAQANAVSGTIWEVATSIAQNAVLGNIPPGSSTGGATFTVNSPLNFSSTATANGYTLGGFLGSAGATGVSYFGTAAATDSLDSTIMGITGFVTVINGQKFQIGHDDGFELMIGSWLFSDPGPTAYQLTTVTYTGAAGNLPFKMAYGECCGPPAYLTVDLPLSGVPEPSTWAMMGLGFAALGFAGYRARKPRVAIA